jgi:hypothetical protein
MTRWINNQTSTLGPTHDLKHTQYESESKLERIIKKEWLCNLSKIFSWMWYVPLSTNFSKGGTHVATHGGKKNLCWFQMRLEKEGPQATYTYHLQQKQGKIQQKPNSYDKGLTPQIGS